MLNMKPHTLTLDTHTEDFLVRESYEHNLKPQYEFKVSTEMLKAVYRRGAKEVISQNRTAFTRDDAAHQRLGAFMHLVRKGHPKNPAYTADNNLLPQGHELSTAPLTAAAANHDISNQLTVTILEKEKYKKPEDAILDLTEYSGYGYKAEAAIRASWLRGIRAGEDPFFRASLLALYGVNSLDRDLLPKDGGPAGE